MPLFEVAILERPTKKEEKDGKFEKLILEPIFIMAKDLQSAGYSAVIKNKDIDIDTDRMEVLIRPFA